MKTCRLFGSLSTEFEINYCEDETLNVCDPTYGVCTNLGQNVYTCECDVNSFSVEEINGVACETVGTFYMFVYSFKLFVT